MTRQYFPPKKVRNKRRKKANRLANRIEIVNGNIFYDEFINCYLCGISLTNRRDVEIHHLVPICFGGTNSFYNLAYLCSECHSFDKIGAGDVGRDMMLYIRWKAVKEYGLKAFLQNVNPELRSRVREQINNIAVEREINFLAAARIFEIEVIAPIAISFTKYDPFDD